MPWTEAIVRWYAVLVACSWSLAPLVRWLCKGLSDRGASIIRPIALLLAVYPGWLIASTGVAPFGVGVVIGTIVLAGIIGWILTWRRRAWDRSWIVNALLLEGSSLLLFLIYVWLRGYTPEILGTEKPMEVAFLASSARTVEMPPPDPWFAGEPINYYYLGYLLHATIGRMSGVAPQTGFNLALATIFSMTAVAAFGVSWNVVRPWLGGRSSVVCGLLAAFAVTLSGNFYAPWRLMQNAGETVNAWWSDSEVGVGWRSSRIVCDGDRIGNLCLFPARETINEFPYFSFLLGDLHPHVMALPFTLVAIALAWNLAQSYVSRNGAFDKSWYPRLALTGVIVGSLYALNAWDFPAFLAIVILGAIASARSTIQMGVRVGILGLSALVAWSPFFLSYAPPTSSSLSGLPGWAAKLPIVPNLLSGFAIHAGERTSIPEYLTMFGAPYAFGVALVLSGLWQYSPIERQGSVRLAILAAVGTGIPGVLLNAPVLPLCGIPLAIAIGQLQRSPSPSPRAFALVAFSCAWLLSIGVEIVFLRDAFGDRMNTLFKFYYQTWTLYGVAIAVAIGLLWHATIRNSWSRVALAAATTAMLLAGLAYPTVATYQWTDRLENWTGLDGLAYGAATDPDDVAAMRWLSAAAHPGDVVLEAAGCSYRPSGRLPFNRVSAFTGIPTVIGWDGHERQWRAGQPELIDDIAKRQADVKSMLADPSSPLFADYNVTWLFVGAYETGDWQRECEFAGHLASQLATDFPGPGWEESYKSGATRVYRRVDA